MTTTPSVCDVAAYVLSRRGPVTAWELQKLCFYAQAWSLATTQAPLFREELQAWTDGPASPTLFAQHRGHYQVASLPIGKPELLSTGNRDVIDRVLSFYGRFTAAELRELTHREEPWREQRVGISPGASSDRVISNEAMQTYYGKYATQFSDPAFHDSIETGLRLLLSVPEDDIASLVEDETDGAPMIDWLKSGGEPPWPSSDEP